MTQDSGGGAPDDVGVALAGESHVECVQGAFAAFVGFERVDGGDPEFDRGIGELLHDVEEVFVQLAREFVDVLVTIQERAEEAACVFRERGEVGQLLRSFPEHVGS